MLVIPGGNPTRCASSARAREVKGVSPGDLQTVVQPAAKAGAIFRVIIAAGKFQLVQLININCPNIMSLSLRCDQVVDANRFVIGENPIVWVAAGDRVAICTRCLLAARFSDGLAILPGDKRGQVLGIADHSIVPLSQEFRAFASDRSTEGFKGPCRGGDCSSGVIDVEFGALTNHRTSRGI